MGFNGILMLILWDLMVISWKYLLVNIEKNNV
jgi:hypothetical protein